MRISSRGTVTMGPAGWMLFIVFIGPVYLLVGLIRLLALLTVAIAREVRKHRAERQVRSPGPGPA
jgi:hypothetical protein